VAKQSGESVKPVTQAPGEAAAWTEHEHVAAPLQVDAQKLIDKAGSPGLAKQAIRAVEDASNAPASPSASSQDEFAQRWGFRSYLELFEASTGVRAAVGKNWLVTALADGGWIVWNDTDLRADTRYSTHSQAVAQVPGRDNV
jgi:hypothetical protein